MSEKREPQAWQYFLAFDSLWQAVADPVDVGGAIGRALRAGRVLWFRAGLVFSFELAGPGSEPAVKLDEIEWVRCSDVGAILDSDADVMTCLRECVGKEPFR